LKDMVRYVKSAIQVRQKSSPTGLQPDFKITQSCISGIKENIFCVRSLTPP